MAGETVKIKARKVSKEGRKGESESCKDRRKGGKRWKESGENGIGWMSIRRRIAD